MMRRRKTREVNLGGVRIGGKAPVSIQSMVKVDTRDVAGCVRQIKRLEQAGCEIVRLALKDEDSAPALKEIKKKIRIPIEADIHFNYKLALAAIDNGADGIRLNPGNVHRKDEIKAVVGKAQKRGVPIRVGVNSGSLPRITNHDLAQRMASSAADYIKQFEAMGFRDIMISLKASDVASTVRAYRLMAERCDYPFHLGITATGLPEDGIVKSSMGIGALLLDGIGDTIRVSLAGDPVEEVSVARKILSSLGLRNFGPEIIACPTCGRCQIDVVSVARRLQREIFRSRTMMGDGRRTKIAIMGCEVNGPGEAKDADVGIAGGRDCGILFKRGVAVRKVKPENFIESILNELITEH